MTSKEGFLHKLLGQWRRPTGRLGRILLKMLNISHAKVSNWGLAHIRIANHFVMIDLGCGGGAVVRKLAAKAPQGKAYGIDISEESAAVSRRTNDDLIGAGRAAIVRASVSALPFAEGYFDLATAVDSHYYWPSLISDLHEVRRILKPGGRLAIIGEAYQGSRFEQRDQLFVSTLKLAYGTPAELSRIVSMAGFSDISLAEEYEKGWVCAIAVKQ
jgi:SAM-dependent methyltransferase